MNHLLNTTQAVKDTHAQLRHAALKYEAGCVVLATIAVLALNVPAELRTIGLAIAYVAGMLALFSFVRGMQYYNQSTALLVHCMAIRNSRHNDSPGV